MTTKQPSIGPKPPAPTEPSEKRPSIGPKPPVDKTGWYKTDSDD